MESSAFKNTEIYLLWHLHFKCSLAVGLMKLSYCYNKHLCVITKMNTFQHNELVFLSTHKVCPRLHDCVSVMIVFADLSAWVGNQKAVFI